MRIGKLAPLTFLTLALSSSSVLGAEAWGEKVAGRRPADVWAHMEKDPAVEQIRSTLAAHTTWERNNVLKEGNYVADKATVTVTPKGMALMVNDSQPGTLESEVTGCKWMLLWRYADVDTEWGKAKAGEAQIKGSVVVMEGEQQWRFPMYFGPGAGFQEVRLVTYKGKTLLYVMEPGTDRYLEEWILK